MRESVVNILTEYQKLIIEAGGEVNEFVVAPTVSRDDVRKVEAKVGRPIPEQVKTFACDVAGKIVFIWSLPSFAAEFDYGELIFDFFNLPYCEQGRKNWGALIHDSENPRRKVFDAAFGVMNLPNGDIIGTNEAGRVVYLSHDGAEEHGLILGRNFGEFILNLCKIGCVGPEADYLKGFVSRKAGGIVPDGRMAKAHRESLQYSAEVETVAKKLDVAMRAKDPRKRLVSLRAIAAEHPSIPGPKAALGEQLADFPEYHDEAEGLLRSALALAGEHSGLLTAFATFCFCARANFKGAERYYLKAIAADSENEIAHGNYALLLMTKLGKLDKAEEHYRKALSIEPGKECWLSALAELQSRRR